MSKVTSCCLRPYVLCIEGFKTTISYKITWFTFYSITTQSTQKNCTDKKYNNSKYLFCYSNLVQVISYFPPLIRTQRSFHCKKLKVETCVPILTVKQDTLQLFPIVFVVCFLAGSVMPCSCNESVITKQQNVNSSILMLHFCNTVSLTITEP